METDELSSYLDALARDECYRVERVLKRSALETTEEVRFVGRNGAESEPRIRKRILASSGMGGAYASIFAAQQAGWRFRFLPRVFDCHEADGEIVVVMEYARGRTLADVVYERDPSVDLAAALFPQICDAASELHEGFDPPIIHRDLKPSNIIVGEAGLTLIDFGIARTYREGADADTAHFGTRAYAPPEQFGFGQTDVRSDVYALGMILYYCLTEKTPEPQRRDAMLADRAIPRPLAGVIDKATSFDPAARYASARELRDAMIAACAACGAFAGGSPALPHRAACGSDGNVQEGRGADGSPADVTAADARGAARARRDRGRLRRTGIAWDALVLVLWLIVVAMSVYVAFVPTGDVASWALERRLVAYFGFMIPLATGIALLVADKRPFERVRPLRDVPRKRYRTIAFALFAIAFASICIATYLL